MWLSPKELQKKMREARAVIVVVADHEKLPQRKPRQQLRRHRQRLGLSPFSVTEKVKVQSREIPVKEMKATMPEIPVNKGILVNKENPADQESSATHPLHANPVSKGNPVSSVSQEKISPANNANHANKGSHAKTESLAKTVKTESPVKIEKERKRVNRLQSKKPSRC
jgi:hypothetical protein